MPCPHGLRCPPIPVVPLYPCTYGVHRGTTGTPVVPRVPLWYHRYPCGTRVPLCRCASVSLYIRSAPWFASRDRPCAYEVKAYIVMADEGMACAAMPHETMARMVMACKVMAYIVMAYEVMACAAKTMARMAVACKVVALYTP